MSTPPPLYPIAKPAVWYGKLVRDEPAVMAARARLGRDFAPPGGESINQVRHRMFAVLMSRIASHQPGHYWVHTHRNAIKTVTAPFFDWSADEVIAQDLALVSLTRIIIQDGKPYLAFYNEPAV